MLNFYENKLCYNLLQENDIYYLRYNLFDTIKRSYPEVLEKITLGKKEDYLNEFIYFSNTIKILKVGLKKLINNNLDEYNEFLENKKMLNFEKFKQLCKDMSLFIDKNYGNIELRKEIKEKLKFFTNDINECEFQSIDIYFIKYRIKEFLDLLINIKIPCNDLEIITEKKDNKFLRELNFVFFNRLIDIYSIFQLY